MNNLNPFFIIYDPRSGSTLLSDIIIKNTNSLILPETNFLINLLLEYDVDRSLSRNDTYKILNILRKDRKINDWNITEKIINIVENSVNTKVNELIKKVLYAYINSFPIAKKKYSIGLKKENYVIIVDKIKKIFPKSKFISIVRDPRGVFLSKKTSLYTGNGKPFEVNPIKSALAWLIFQKRINYISAKYPGSILIVNYEHLIKEPDLIISKIANFLRLNLVKNETKISLHKRYKELHKNLDQELIIYNDVKWQKNLTYKEILFIEFTCEKCLSFYGYKNIYLNVIRKPLLLFLFFKIEFYIINLLLFFKLKLGSVIYNNSGLNALGRRY